MSMNFEEFVNKLTSDVDYSDKEDAEKMKAIASILHSCVSESLIDDMKKDNPELTDDMMRQFLLMSGISSDFFRVLFELVKKIIESDKNPFVFDLDAMKVLVCLAMYVDGDFEVFGNE